MEGQSNEQFINDQIEIEEIPSVSQLEMEVLEPQYLRVMLINLVIVYALLFGGLLYGWWMDAKGVLNLYVQWILLGFLLLFLLNLYLIFKGYQHKAYAIRHHDISYKSGWLWRKTTTVPFSRVQHCEVSQNIIDRFYNLARLKVYTAGGSSSDVLIPGLNIDVANDLKGYVLNKVEEHE